MIPGTSAPPTGPTPVTSTGASATSGSAAPAHRGLARRGEVRVKWGSAACGLASRGRPARRGTAQPGRGADVGGLDGQVAVVTGASSGIGKAIALALAGKGADVVVNYARSQALAEQVAAEIVGMGRRALVVRADVSLAAEVGRLLGDALDRFARIDVWVNNAGADILTGEVAAWPDEAKWERVMAVDLKGTWLCSRAAGEAMMKRGGGAIVNVSWDHVLHGMGNPTAAIYAAAKGGVLALSRCLAREFAPRVRVNVVAPGWINTKWLEGAGHATREAVIAATPLGRWGTPEDVAAAVVFLASPESSFITGETILVGGGVVMG
ncbi:MAG: 3-oxoacyl-ACP reductase FabG [candidate division NC10 bacterium]|nr:3-oxoacyl-ACP reductase FabG [candidate division NC10 bacterium]